jgi:hypothetical protein
LRGVTTFRRSSAFTVFAALLIMLGLSPVTAPFSVLSFAAAAHRGASVVVHRTVPPVRTGAQSFVFVSSVDGRTAIVRLAELPLRFLGSASDRESTLFAVLRI